MSGGGCVRLFGSYEALEGGMTNDALVDFTGGIGYRVDLTDQDEQDLFAWMQNQNKMNTLMSCSIYVCCSSCRCCSCSCRTCNCSSSSKSKCKSKCEK